ncbi:uncharacterized protein LOC125448141 isoform X2 [Stegostoma tigrinum]|uniref:uncharacterized protein LOC125448141 isoform X2 n=1 Tax=Stegostoma tigrinum TaxID=3053191 RepID=UPI002870498B|nr:uncharacterized protein LOC125448141 isoform X2 [Stegostoma tigrinum]
MLSVFPTIADQFAEGIMDFSVILWRVPTAFLMAVFYISSPIGSEVRTRFLSPRFASARSTCFLTMPSAMKPLIYLLLASAILVNLSLAQHWSFDLRPGGKRAAGDTVVGAFQDAPRDATNKMTEVFSLDCPGCLPAKRKLRKNKL